MKSKSGLNVSILGFGILLVISIFLTPILAGCIKHNSFFGLLALKITSVFSRNPDRNIGLGIFFILLLLDCFVCCFVLKPAEIYGKDLGRFYLALIRSLNPFYKTTKFARNYQKAKFSLHVLKRTNNKRYTDYLITVIERKMEQMHKLDPESPLLKEFAGEFYNVKTDLSADTPISSELKEWVGLTKKISDDVKEERKSQKIGIGYLILGLGMGFGLIISALTIDERKLGIKPIFSILLGGYLVIDLLRKFFKGKNNSNSS